MHLLKLKLTILFDKAYGIHLYYAIHKQY